MKRRLLFPIIISLCLLSSCMNVRTPTVGTVENWKPFQKGQVYHLNESVFIKRVKGGLEPVRLLLVPVSISNRGASSPESVDVDLKDSEIVLDDDSLGVIGVCEEGTLFEPHKIKRNSGYSMWYGFHSETTKYGKILSGDYKGKTVSLESISCCIGNCFSPHQAE